jgi:hypothetical protein
MFKSLLVGLQLGKIEKKKKKKKKKEKKEKEAYACLYMCLNSSLWRDI